MATMRQIGAGSSQNCERKSQKRDACVADEARALVRRCALPCPEVDSAKAAVRRAARRLGFSFSRTKDIWYGRDASRIRADEMDRLRDVADRVDAGAAVQAVERLRQRLIARAAPHDAAVVAGINAALGILVTED